MFDSHCHLDSARFDAERDAVVARARAVGVTGILVPGVEPAEWPRLADVKARYPEVRIAVGLHPQALPGMSAPAIERALAELEATARGLGAVAVGECGFDGGTHGQGGVAWETQALVVDTHVRVAQTLGLPLVLHVLRAHDQALRALERHGPLGAGGVMHSYSGPAELVPRYVALGLSVSFAGSITRERARRPVDAARVVPADRLLVETDAPDQTPTGADRERCEPAHVALVIAALARARGVTPDEIARLTARNALALFGG